MKKENNCIIIDFVIPYDTWKEQKEKRKVMNIRISRKNSRNYGWNMRVNVVPVSKGALGTPPKCQKKS